MRLSETLFLALRFAVLLLVPAFVASSSSFDLTQSAQAQTTAVSLQRVVRGLTEPLFVTGAGDSSGRLFVAERSGVIRIVVGGQVLATPFLDLSSLVETGGSEQGLLGLAFDPSFKTNGRFFV